MRGLPQNAAWCSLVKMHGTARVYEVDDGIFFETGVDEKAIRVFIATTPEDDTRPIRLSIIDGPDELASIDLSITAFSMLADQNELIAQMLQKTLDGEDE